MKHREEGVYEGEFQVSEAPGFRSRETAPCAAAAPMVSGTVIAKLPSGRVTPWVPAGDASDDVVYGVLLTPYEPWVNGLGVLLPRQVTVFECDAEFDLSSLTFPAGVDAAATAANRAAGIAGLLLKKIKVR